ncbi:50S ribosomal protein L24 [Seleniivibrio woodruffii]|uniref:50S ribosomal protein L24 n=1 Tax=Seleniivibrio woodruffii TaxID=1078050 RepID=UPI0026E98457|nr:50S ribosomal protein L24 [Seleniivibrio woodruffii]
MSVKLKIKKDDPVIVTTGKDKGQKTKVVKMDRDNGKVFCEGVNVSKKHVKPNQFNPDGGIVDKTMPLAVSNVMYYCEKCSKGVKLGIKVLESGKKVRFCRACGEVIDK